MINRSDSARPMMQLPTADPRDTVLRHWRFRAVDADGNLFHGRILADDVDTALGQLEARGLDPLSIRPVREGLARFWQKLARSGSLVAGPAERHAALAEAWSAVGLHLAAARDLPAALDAAAQGGISRTAARGFGGMAAAIRAGQSPAEAATEAGRDLGPVAAAVFAVAARTGRLAPAIDDLAHHHETEATIHARITRALRYPIVLAVTTFASLVALIGGALPELAGLMAELGVAGDDPTLQLAIAVGDAPGLAIGVIIGLPAALVAGLLIVRRHPAVARLLDRWTPIVRLRHQLAAARSLRALILAAEAGAPVTEALELAAIGAADPELARQLGNVRRLIIRGVPPAEAFTLLEPWPAVAQAPLVAGAAAGRLPDAARSASRALDRSIERSVDRLTALLEPALVMFLALVVAGIGRLVLGALYSGLAEVGG